MGSECSEVDGGGEDCGVRFRKAQGKLRRQPENSEIAVTNQSMIF